MAIEDALSSLLTADPGVKALLQSRVFGIKTPEVGNPLDDLPAVAYKRISCARWYTMDVAKGVTVLARARFQFDCKAKNYPGAREVARVVAEAMRGFAGTVEGVAIREIFDADDRDVPYDMATKIYVVEKDFQVSYLE